MLQFANGDFIPNVFEYVIPESAFEAPAKFAENELDTNFLLNGGGIVLAHITNGVLLVVSLVASKIFPNKPYFSKTADSLKLAAPIRIAIEGALELCLAVSLQFRNLFDPDIYNIMGCVGCAICIIGYVVFIYIVWTKVVLQPISVLEEENHKKHYEGIYEGYKLEFTRHKAWILIEIFRKMVYVALLVLLTDHPKMQISSLIILQFGFFTANAVIRPYESDTKNYLKLMMEGGLICAFIAFGLLINNKAESEYVYIITMIVLGILLLQIGSFALYVILVGMGGMLITAVNVVKKVCKKIRDKCNKDKHARDQTIDVSDAAVVEVVSETYPMKYHETGSRTHERMKGGVNHGGKDHLILFE